MIEILPYGDTAMLINFEQRISRKIHHKVAVLKIILDDLAGVTSVVPAYASLTVVFDPVIITYTDLHDAVRSIKPLEDITEPESRIHEIPVCYDNEFGPDLPGLAVQIGKSEEEIILAHTSTEFYVYMIGFMPGFGYMGDMPKDFSCHRKPVPRTHVTKGSVGLAGRQTAIYPFECPGGWQLIGRTPTVVFDPQRNEPNLLRAGDIARFFRISSDEFQSISES